MIALLQLLAGRPPEPPLDPAQWRALLALADRTRSATLLHGSPHTPRWFAEEIATRVEKNAIRRRRLLAAYDEAHAALTRARIDFVLLKGFTHEAGFGIDPALRAPTDLDLRLRPHDLPAARNALIAAGYTPHKGRTLSADHAPPLLKPAAWQWTGDYYDPAFPAVVELHHTLWNSTHDRIHAPGAAAFWTRRVTLEIEGRRMPALDDADRLGFAALHLLRHTLGNDASPAHACELARALRHRAHDAAFWDRWRRLHPAGLRRLETIAFQFAAQWFETPLPPAPREEWDAMPAPVRQWFRAYAFSPILNLTEPNKDVLWLHLALVPHFADRLAVARRRLFPLHLPRRGDTLRRLRYHTLALARMLLTARRPRTAASSASLTSS